MAKSASSKTKNFQTRKNPKTWQRDKLHCHWSQSELGSTRILRFWSPVPQFASMLLGLNTGRLIRPTVAIPQRIKMHASPLGRTVGPKLPKDDLKHHNINAPGHASTSIGFPAGRFHFKVCAHLQAMNMLLLQYHQFKSHSTIPWNSQCRHSLTPLTDQPIIHVVSAHQTYELQWVSYSIHNKILIPLPV